MCTVKFRANTHRSLLVLGLFAIQLSAQTPATPPKPGAAKPATPKPSNGLPPEVLKSHFLILPSDGSARKSVGAVRHNRLVS